MANFTPNTILTADALNAAFAEKANASEVYKKDEVYTTAQIGALLAQKADSSNTYTKLQADAKIDEKIQELDVNDAIIDGLYVTAVSQEDGLIAVSKAQLPVSKIKNGEDIVVAEADGTVKLPKVLTKISLGPGYVSDDCTVDATGVLNIPLANGGNAGVTRFHGIKKTNADALASSVDADGFVTLPAASAGSYGLTNIAKVQLGGDDTTAVTVLDVATDGTLELPMAKAGNVGVTKIASVYFPKGKEDSDGWDVAEFGAGNEANGVLMRRAKYAQYGVATVMDAEHILDAGAVKDLTDMSNEALVTERALGRYLESRLGSLAGALILKGQVSSSSDAILSDPAKESGWEVIAAGDFELIQSYGTIQVRTSDTLICMDDKEWHVFRPNVAVDDAMSDTSVNPVQNKVVKQYIEENGAQIKLDGEGSALPAVSGVVTLPKIGTSHAFGITHVADIKIPQSLTPITPDANGVVTLPVTNTASAATTAGSVIPGLVYQMIAEAIHEPTDATDTTPIIDTAFEAQNTNGTGKTFVPTVAAMEKYVKLLIKQSLTNVFSYDATTDTLTCDLTKLD